ncbi:MAG: hypothetical protein QM647_15735 [Asticcacaulis sp.]|uniref:hypothetical protein n=1 Tax=Asticcacaulis sp. TaxID=1872648 RepID=UPI0039E3C190
MTGLFRLGLFCFGLLWLAPIAGAMDLTTARLVTAERMTPQAEAAVTLLKDEVARRSGTTFSGQGLSLVIARRDEIAGLLPAGERALWRYRLRSVPAVQAEAYEVATIGQTLIIAGDDDRGILFGIGYLLRKAELSAGHAVLPDTVDTYAAPQMPWRAHQIGYRFKNNSYDAFTLDMFEPQVRDLAVFGANGVQWIAPISDDAAESPLFHAKPLDMAIAVSGLMAKYGLDFDLYYPQMADDYRKPDTRAAELARFEDLVKRLPRIDALYVPGGDPGHTEPDVLFPLVAAEVAILHRYHPGATVWISGQGFDAAQYERFYTLLARKPAWLTGVFFGPQSRDPLPVQRARIPKRYPIIFYPDIAHTMHSQFPVPQWDPAFALTEGREPINPQPRAQSQIIRHFANDYAGFATYSEGVNDDVNKMLWSQLGWDVNARTDDVLADYARYFIGDARFAEGLKALEHNWDGPVALNTDIGPTLMRFEDMARDHTGNWRFDMAFYRATFDAYVQKRYMAEKARETLAYKAIGMGDVSAARRALAERDGADITALRQRLFDLAEQLYREIGLQLSVKLYGASGIERGANLDRVDVSLNDRIWLERQLDEVEHLEAPLRTLRLKALANGDTSPPGGFYDDLGDPQNEPHLVRGTGFGGDPEAYDSAIDGIADTIPDDGWRIAWVTYAETLYEGPITLQYNRLDPKMSYRLKIVYAGEGYALPIKLTGNGMILQDFAERTHNPMTVELDIPQGLIRDGTLRLEWVRPAGLGGSGRGHQVAQVWLLPVAKP